MLKVTLGKQVQWAYGDQYRKIFWMMGLLHVEIVIGACIGDWLQGSGWGEIYANLNISTPGRIESALKGNKIKRSRYTHQVALYVLRSLAKHKFKKQTAFTYFEEWKHQKRQTSVNADYWFTVIDLYLLLFAFVKSLREANFDLFVRCLENILPWTFTLHHVHYARWLSVFLHDLYCLPADHPSLFQEFLKGNFTVKKSNRVFSNMGFDQAHEQCNKLVKSVGGAIGIKSVGGAIGILDSEDAFLDWAVAGP